MKYFFAVMLISFPTLLFSQEWGLGSGAGYATAETRSFKKIILVTETYLAYEMPLGNDYYLHTGIAISSLRFNYQDSFHRDVFNTKYFLTIPLSIKKYFYLSRNSKAFIDFGLQGSYLLSDQKEFTTTGPEIEKVKRFGLGFNAGFMGSIGYKKDITHTISFDISISGRIDYFSHYKYENDQIKTNKRIVGLTFYKKIKK